MVHGRGRGILIVARADNKADIMQAIIDARKESGLTQKQLSEKTGITQADISRLERGNANPSLLTLQRLASGMNMRLKLEFVKTAAE